jgi:uncharacterized membrane-anchored protein
VTPDVDDPFRVVAIVVGVLAVLFVAILLAVQFGSQSIPSVLSIPLYLAVPVIVGAVYYHIRFRT